MRHDIRHPALSALAALAVLSGPAALAQTSPDTPNAPQVKQSPAGIPYISGGAGEEERNSMAARAGELPLKVVLSESAGEYVIADRLSVVTPQGELLLVRDAGPVVMMRLQPGTYTLEATWKGRTERRTVRVGNGAESVNWRLEG